MQQVFFDNEFFYKELHFVEAAPHFCEAAQQLVQLPEEEAAALCGPLLDRMDQVYNDDILLRSYNGYVTFSAPRAYRDFLEATRSSCAAYEMLAERGLDPLRCRKTAVYFRVMGLSAATRDFKYKMLDSDRKVWDDEIFKLEKKILEEDPNYTVPSSQLPQNQRDLLVKYWLQRPKEYWQRHQRLEKFRSRLDLYKRIINAFGVAMLVIPMLFFLVCLFTGTIHIELTMMVMFCFVAIGVGVYLFGYLRRRMLRAIKEFEFQGVGQINRLIPPPDSAETRAK